MHLGNARTALLAWLDARARGGRVILRIEDLDRDRCRPEHAEALRRDLVWLGLDWDEETAPQSTRDDAYAGALARLGAQGLLYECFCTRRELHEASAPHGPGDEPPRYPGTCRDLTDAERAARRAGGRRPALRLAMPDVEVELADRVHGRLSERVAELTGDIVVRRSDGLVAYQLAVVVDDAADGVTDVVRGDDLLPSAPRQAALAGLLGLTSRRTPTYRSSSAPTASGWPSGTARWRSRSTASGASNRARWSAGWPRARASATAAPRPLRRWSRGSGSTAWTASLSSGLPSRLIEASTTQTTHRLEGIIQMQNVQLGSQGLTVSRQGLGCMGMSEFYGRGDDAESIATIHRALELGVTLLDTSDMYGPFTNEQLVGKAIAGRRDAGRAGHQVRHRARPGRPDGARRQRQPELRQRAPATPRSSASASTTSTSTTSTASIPRRPIEETVGAMAELVDGRQGALPRPVRGVAGDDPPRATRCTRSRRCRPSTRCGARDPEDEILADLRELGIGFVPYSPLGRGFLTGPFRRSTTSPPDDFRRSQPRFQGENFDREPGLVERVEALAAEKGATPAQLALAWVLAQGDDIVPDPRHQAPQVPGGERGRARRRADRATTWRGSIAGGRRRRATATRTCRRSACEPRRPQAACEKRRCSSGIWSAGTARLNRKPWPSAQPCADQERAARRVSMPSASGCEAEVFGELDDRSRTIAAELSSPAGRG